MELKTLKYFVEVAREQNISKAAKRLYLSQPTLTKQIQDLENELGVTLFERGKRKTTLTDEGFYLYKKAQEILELEEKTRLAFKHEEDNISGDISIACGESYAMNLIIKGIVETRKKYKDITFSFYSGNDQDVHEKLNNGLAEFALFIGITNLEKYNYIKLPLVETWGLLMNKTSPLAKKEVITKEDLLSIPLLVSKQMLESNELNGWLGEDFNKLKIIGTYNLIYNASLMAKNNAAYVVTIDKLIENSDDLIFIKFSPSITSSIYLAWKKYQMLSKADQVFLNILNKIILKNS